jgi:hypothetical protein
MFSLQGLDIFDFESLDIQVVQPQERDSIVDIESQAKGSYEILPVHELAVGRTASTLVPHTPFGAPRNLL